MTTNATADGLLGQILQEVQATRAEVTALKVSTAQLVSDARHREKQVDDHEDRIRHVETAVAANVTQDDLAAVEQRRRSEVADALALSDRKANKRLVIIGLVMTAVIAAINVGIAFLR